jgi:DNA (cytosine-5)-methyltransferase 1
MNYYNDNDPKACAWLRELIAAGEIAPGHVDERSILEINPDDLAGFDQCHFFAGIGGWALALRWAGLEGVAGIWSGSCPCQPLSCAGQRKGHADERHLWPAFHDLIAKRRPATVFGEQVASKDGREWFAGVRLDLEGLGYACGGADLCAAGVGAPHRRQRLFWVADSNGRDEGHGGLQRGREHGQRAPDGGVVRMADAGHERMRRAAGTGEAAIGRALAEGSGRGVAGGVAHPEHDGGRADQPGRGGHADRAGWAGVAAGGVADSESIGRPAATRPRKETEDGSANANAGDARKLQTRPVGSSRAGWSRFDILPCQDGKARRAPAWSLEPIFQLLADGIWCSMVSGWSESVENVKERTLNHAEETRSGTSEVLRALREATEQEAIRERVGGYDAIQGATILLFALLQLEGQMGQVIERDAPGVSKDGGVCVPALRSEAEGVARPPQERRLDGQQTGELHDIVSALSQELAQRHEEAAQVAVACMGSPLVGKIPGRMGLLRGYGNAIVPEVAEVFVRAWVDCRANAAHDGRRKETP